MRRNTETSSNFSSRRIKKTADNIGAFLAQYPLHAIIKSLRSHNPLTLRLLHGITPPLHHSLLSVNSAGTLLWMTLTLCPAHDWHRPHDESGNPIPSAGFAIPAEAGSEPVHSAGVAERAEAFAPFFPGVRTRWDDQWLYVESNGMPHLGTWQRLGFLQLGDDGQLSFDLNTSDTMGFIRITGKLDN